MALWYRQACAVIVLTALVHTVYCGENNQHEPASAKSPCDDGLASDVYYMPTVCEDSTFVGTEVYCDMDTDGGGWTVIQKRATGAVDFWLGWDNYTAGFGDANAEHWIGLRLIHAITACHASCELRIDMEDKEGDRAFAKYQNFVVSGEDDFFRLSIGTYEGNAGDALTFHHGQQFSTKDADHDQHNINCALKFKGAWWYKNCHNANLNGQYGNDENAEGISWYPWKNNFNSLKGSSMKIRCTD